MLRHLHLELFRRIALAAIACALLPAAALAQDLTCGDAFTDSGGLDGDYAINEDITTVICPTAGSDEVVTVTFTAFETETGWDELFAYDGSTTDGDLISRYSGSAVPGPITSLADDGCLTFRFASDGSVVRAGWAADVTCGARAECPALGEVAALEFESTVASVAVGFTRRGGVVTVEAELGAPGFAPGTGAAIATATDSDVDSEVITFSGLPAATDYEIYVRPDCAEGGGTGQGAWAGPFAVATRVTPPAYDDCGDAAAVTMQPVGEDCAPTSLTSAGATASGGASDFPSFDDVFVAFEATAPLFEVTFTSEDDDTPLGAVIVELFDECGGEPIEGFFSEEIGEPLPLATRLDVGQTYRLRVVTGDVDAIVDEIDFGICVRAFEPPLLTCGDVFTDRGGESADYGVNEDYAVVICPADGSGEAVTVTFTEFATEEGFDFLTVADGSDGTGEPFETFSGGVLPGAITSSAPDGCLTFRFTSDGSVTAAGWRADVTCGAFADCPAPANLAIAPADLTATAAAVSFIRRANNPTIVAEIGAPGFAPGTGAALETVTVSSADSSVVRFGDLLGSTAYEVYLRSDCEATGGTGQSDFAGPFAFATRPVNDECADATALTMADADGECTVASLTTIGATASGGPSNFQPAAEVFVTFVATAPYFSTELTKTNDDDGLDVYAIEVFEDCVTDPIGDYTTGQLGVPAAAPIELVVGETYVLSIVTLEATFFGLFVSEADFDLCIRAFDAPPAPTNDDCSAPAILVDADGVVTEASGATYSAFLGALDADIAAVPCDTNFNPGTADDDLFFQVTLPNVGDSARVTAGGANDLVMTVFAPEACGAAEPTQLTCADDQIDSTPESLQIVATEPGQTFLIQVYSYSSSAAERAPYTVTAEVGLITSLSNVAQGPAFEVYPNPTRVDGEVTVVLPQGLTDASAELSLTDATGREVYRHTGFTGQRTVTLTPGGLSAGVYFLSLDAAAARSTQRIIVE